MTNDFRRNDLQYADEVYMRNLKPGDYLPHYGEVMSVWSSLMFDEVKVQLANGNVLRRQWDTRIYRHNPDKLPKEENVAAKNYIERDGKFYEKKRVNTEDIKAGYIDANWNKEVEFVLQSADRHSARYAYVWKFEGEDFIRALPKSYREMLVPTDRQRVPGTKWLTYESGTGAVYDRHGKLSGLYYHGK